MDSTITLKRLDDNVIKKLEFLHSAQIDIKELISNAILDYEIEERVLKSA